MSSADKPNEPTAPEGARPNPVPAEPSVPARSQRPASTRPAARPRGGGSLALALLLSLAALAVAGYVGWQQWQQRQNQAADSQGVASLQQRLDTLEATLSGLTEQRAGLNQRLDDAARINRSLREELLGQAERTRHVEDALATLAEKSLSGRDGMLLDDTESLLRMGAERYRLFHDAQAAATAYALADQTLAAVNDGVFSGLRQSINAEREALMNSQPASQAAALQQLTKLRGSIAGLPLKPIDADGTEQARGGWARIGHALAGVISVQRDNGAPLAVADARLSQQLAELDLAQAQAALLAHDSEAYIAALQRVDASLSSQFDTSAAAVRQAREALAKLASQLPTDAPVELGAALTELRNLRAVHALNPAEDDVVPATASSTSEPADEARP